MSALGWRGFLAVDRSPEHRNLAFARFNLRRKEFATRMAIGAGRAHLTRQLVIENATLGLAGGLLGTIFGAGLLPALTGIRLDRIPCASEVRMDPVVAVFSLGLAVLAAVLTSFIPLVAIFGASLNEELRQGGRSGSGGGRARFTRKILVAAQIGFAFALLVGAGLLLASFRQVLRIDPGFRTEGIVTPSINAPRSRYAGDAEVRSVVERVSGARCERFPTLHRQALPLLSRSGATAATA